MKLTRTPPVAACASTAETSIANSCVPAAFGTAPPPQPPPMPELSATPLTIMRWSLVRPPLADSAATSATTAPPTSRPPKLWVTPAISTPKANGFRELGICDTISCVIDTCRVVLCKSTVGVAPETVIVSSTAPTARSAFAVTTLVPVSSSSSRTTVLNPGSVNVTRYVPGRRSGMM